jgi:hypothetical protein
MPGQVSGSALGNATTVSPRAPRLALAAELGRAVVGALASGDVVAARAAARALVAFIDVLAEGPTS